MKSLYLKQLLKHLETNNLLAKFQSAYRKFHSCETALLKIHDDILTVVDGNTNILLVLLDLSSAFDTINHRILLSKLKKDYFIDGKVLSWFDSYLNNRFFMIKIKDKYSNGRLLRYGVPQGSILGPLLFILYTKELEDLAKNSEVNIHMFADDTQLYIWYNKDDAAMKVKTLEIFLENIKSWKDKHFLRLNESKTRLIQISSPRSRLTDIEELKFNGSTIIGARYVENLGFDFAICRHFVIRHYRVT